MPLKLCLLLWGDASRASFVYLGDLTCEWVEFGDRGVGDATRGLGAFSVSPVRGGRGGIKWFLTRAGVASSLSSKMLCTTFTITVSSSDSGTSSTTFTSCFLSPSSSSVSFREKSLGLIPSGCDALGLIMIGHSGCSSSADITTFILSKFYDAIASSMSLQI